MALIGLHFCENATNETLTVNGDRRMILEYFRSELMNIDPKDIWFEQYVLTIRFCRFFN